MKRFICIWARFQSVLVILFTVVVLYLLSLPANLTAQSRYSFTKLFIPLFLSGNKVSWLDERYCNVNCSTGVACEYRDEVDFRVIVMTFSRAEGLQRTLNQLLKLETLGDRVSIDIWIDRSKTGVIDAKTNKTAFEFKKTFGKVLKKGRVCVHHQKSNAFINGQWIDTWRPKLNTTEIGLMLEDDVSVAPMSYKWLKTVFSKYNTKYGSKIAGYTLQMENVNFFAGKGGKMEGPKEHQVFTYPVLGTWGFAPNPDSWREFQDWYKDMRPTRSVETDKIKPFVENILPTSWYRSFLKSHTQEAMWEMWHIKYAEIKRRSTLYPNLIKYTNKINVLLSNNRLEKGLHYSGDGSSNKTKLLLVDWNETFENLPEFNEITHYNYNGVPCTKTCCFSTKC